MRPATAYELCKLQNVTDSDINDEGRFLKINRSPTVMRESV